MRGLVRLGRNRPLRRCVFLKRVMDSVRVIIRNVIPDHTAQMHVIEDDQVIQKFPATTSDPAFSPGHSSVGSRSPLSDHLPVQLMIRSEEIFPLR
jgi:hypothetical protein